MQAKRWSAAGSSNARAEEFTRARLIVGVAVITLVAAVLALVAGRMRGADDPGRLYYVREGNVMVRSLATGETDVFAGLPEGAGPPLISPDGRWLAYGLDGGVWLAAAGQEATRVADGDPLVFSPDGSVTVRRPTPAGTAELVNVSPGGSQQALLRPDMGAPDGPVVWIDRDRFAVRTVDGDDVTLDIVDVDGERPRTYHVIAHATPLAASPDGAELLVAVAMADGQRLEIVSLSTRESSPIGPRGTFRTAEASADGVVAVSGRLEDGRQGIFVLSGDSDDVVAVATGDLERFSWTEDGSHILYVSEAGEILLTEAAAPTGATTLGVIAERGWLSVA